MKIRRWSNEIGPGPSTLMSFCRDVKGIEFYLNYGADPLVRYQRHGKTRASSPLRDQAYRHNYAGVRRLLQHLGWAVDVFWAGIMGDIDSLRELLTEDGSLVDAKTGADHVLGAGLSPLHLAAQGGHLDAMQLLLDADADVNAGRYARIYAAAFCHLLWAEAVFRSAARSQRDGAGYRRLSPLDRRAAFSDRPGR